MPPPLMRTPVLAALAALLVAPSAALADGGTATVSGQAPTTTTPAPTTTTTPAPAPTPAGGRISLEIGHVIRYRGTRIVLLGRAFVVRGSISRFVPGQHVAVRFTRDGRFANRVSVPVRRAAGGRGSFTAHFRARRPGRVRAHAGHAPTAAQHGASTQSGLVFAQSASLGRGSRGVVVRLVQRRLADLHFSTSRGGVLDGRTADAVFAYRHINGLGRSFSTNTRTVRKLASRQGGFRLRFHARGRRVEGDLAHQVIALINNNRVYRIYRISSGKPSTPTILGRFHFYRRQPGFNNEGMYYSSYFIRGYAIHGYFSVPTYPASHGCLRTPLRDAHAIYRWIRLGNRIDVYY